MCKFGWFFVFISIVVIYIIYIGARSLLIIENDLDGDEMKRKNNMLKLSILSVVIFGITQAYAAGPGPAAAAAAAAAANGGTINFTGKITDVSCTVKLNGQSSTGSVTLPTVSQSNLAKADDVAGLTPFTVSLENCTQNGAALTGTSSKASVFFEPGATVNPTTGTLINTSHSPTAATNVDLQVLEGPAFTKLVNVGDWTQVTNNTSTQINTTGITKLPYAVRYHALGTATAGEITSSVVYDINYN